MPSQPTTITAELVAAARGVAAIVAGDRRAAGYFDFSRRGLAGSFIALLLAMTVGAYLPMLTGGASDPGEASPGRLLCMVLFLLAAQVGFAALVLRQLNRLDGFVPYLVADNWASFFLTAISTLLSLVGITGDFVLVVLSVLVLLVEINIARLIVTLSPWQIAMFLIAQVIGMLVGLLVLATIFPLPPELMAGAS